MKRFAFERDAIDNWWNMREQAGFHSLRSFTCTLGNCTRYLTHRAYRWTPFSS